MEDIVLSIPPVNRAKRASALEKRKQERSGHVVRPRLGKMAVSPTDIRVIVPTAVREEAPGQPANVDELIFNVSQQQYSLLHTQNGITDDQVGGGNSTMSVSDNYGNQFFCFLTDNRLRCGRWRQDTDTTDFVDINQPNAKFNDTHNCPAVGIDRDGFIHLMGGFHNDAMYYYVSNDPVAATRDSAFPTTEAGWTLQTINGFDPANANAQGQTANGMWVGYDDSNSATVISYVAFTYDSNMKLYCSMRACATGESQRHGGRAYFLSSYDETTKTWSPVGDFNADGSSKNTLYTNHANVADPIVQGQVEPFAPCVLWSQLGNLCWASSGGAPSSPQGYQAWAESARPFIDSDGRIHVAAKVHRGYEFNSGSNASMAVYFYSDDGGLTWFDAAGNSLTNSVNKGSSPVVLLRSEFEVCPTAVGSQTPNAGTDQVPGNWATNPDYAIAATIRFATGNRLIRVSAAGRNSQGEPVVKWRLQNGPVEIATYTGGQWVVDQPGWTFSEQQLLIDENSNFSISKSNTIRYSANDGATWNTMAGGTSSAYNRNDIRWFKRTGWIRDSHANTAGNKITNAQVRFVEFVTPIWSTYSDTQGVNNVRPVLAGDGQITGNVGSPIVSAEEEGTNIPLGTNYTTNSGGTLNIQSNGSYTFTPPATVVDRGATDIISLAI